MRSIQFIALAIIIAMSCLIFPPTSTNVSASSGAVTIQPFYINVNSITTSLSFTGNTANCYARIVGVSGTSRITASVVLERKLSNGTYSHVKTWSNLSATGSTLTFDEKHSVTSGYTYRMTINATVTRNGISENVSGSSERIL